MYIFFNLCSLMIEKTVLKQLEEICVLFKYIKNIIKKMHIMTAILHLI